MASDFPMTRKLANALHGDRDAMTDVVPELLEVAREIALKKLKRFPELVRRVQDQSDVASMAIWKSLKYMKDKKTEVLTRNQFYKLLHLVISGLLADLARKKNLDVRHQKELTGSVTPYVEDASEIETKELSDELDKMMERVAAAIEDEPDKIKREIGKLGVLDFKSGSQIQKELAAKYPGEVPSISGINLTLRRLRSRLASELGKELTK